MSPKKKIDRLEKALEGCPPGDVLSKKPSGNAFLRNPALKGGVSRLGMNHAPYGRSPIILKHGAFSLREGAQGEFA